MVQIVAFPSNYTESFHDNLGFTETAHIKLIEEGYVTAIVIIFSGQVSQSTLLVSSLVAIIRNK